MAAVVERSRNGSCGIDTFVPENHPASSSSAAKKQSIGMHLGPMKGEYTLVSHKYRRFYRVPERTRNAAPTSYSMTAPMEWFAECYAEYYRAYQGPGTENKKGGQLAGWIRTWFDHNIDTLQYNPSRVDRQGGGLNSTAVARASSSGVSRAMASISSGSTRT